MTKPSVHGPYTFSIVWRVVIGLISLALAVFAAYVSMLKGQPAGLYWLIASGIVLAVGVVAIGLCLTGARRTPGHRLCAASMFVNAAASLFFVTDLPSAPYPASPGFFWTMPDWLKIAFALTIAYSALHRAVIFARGGADNWAFKKLGGSASAGNASQDCVQPSGR